MHLITENMSKTKCLESQDGVEREEREKDSRYVFLLSYKADFEEMKRFISALNFKTMSHVNTKLFVFCDCDYKNAIKSMDLVCMIYIRGILAGLKGNKRKTS